MWFRKEQLLTVTWAGDPSKPMTRQRPAGAVAAPLVRRLVGDRARHRAALVGSELALARAIGGALVDIIVQVNAVRLLIAEHQLDADPRDRRGSREPVVIADDQGRTLFSNEAFLR
jgi:chemotaxis family two-component system sensor kinase Cph1